MRKLQLLRTSFALALAALLAAAPARAEFNPASPSDSGLLFGTGVDGDVTISSGTTTLTRDMHYRNLTLSGTGILATEQFRVFVSGALDISAAQAGAIIAHAVANGSAAAGATGGALQGATASKTLPSTTNGSAGGTGTTTTGGNGGASGTTAVFSNGGLSAVGGAGGVGSSAAGTGGTTGVISATILLPTPTRDFIFSSAGTIAAPVVSSLGSTGGGAGGGDGASAGGGGGGAPRGGGSVALYARTIARGSNATAGIISVKGGTGGPGAPGVAGTAGGGGGGGGGSAGWFYGVCNNLTGSVIPNAIDISGGTGGPGGNSPSTHTGGTGGTGGYAGNAQLLVLSQSGVTTGIVDGGTLSASGFNSTTFSTAGAAAVTATTTAGTAGGVAASLKVGL